MLQEDYLIRMIRLAVAALATVLGLKQSGSYQKAQDLIAVTLTQLTGMDDRLLTNLDDDSLLAVLSNQQGLDYDRVLIVADLLKEGGDIYQATHGPGEARPCYQRALALYLEAALGPVEYPPAELDERIEAVLTALNGTALPAEILYPLWFYFEQAGQYGRAILTLEGLLRQVGPDPELKEQGQVFFQHLAQRDESRLAAGGTSRAMVLEKSSQVL